MEQIQTRGRRQRMALHYIGEDQYHPLGLSFSIILLVPLSHRPLVGDKCRGLPEGDLEPPFLRAWVVSHQLPMAFLTTLAPMLLITSNLINKVVFKVVFMRNLLGSNRTDNNRTDNNRTDSNRTDRINPRSKVPPGIISIPTMA